VEVTEQEPSGGTLATGAVAALAAAVAGAIAWGLIVRWTEYEVGIVAWAIGWLAGTAAVLGARGARGVPLQAAAVVAALLGVLLGKYLGFAWAVQADIEELGPVGELVFDSGLLSGDMRGLFRDELESVFGWFDLLWVGLAAFTAWRVPARPAPATPDPPPTVE
jgi:hypothetical protein